MPEDAGHLIRMLERFPTTPRRFTPDEKRAYLVARGQVLALDLDLGQVEAEDLEALGRLDVLGKHPALPEGVAVALEMVMEKRNAAKSPYVNRPGQGWSGEGDDPGTYTVQAPDLQERSPDDVPLFRPEIRRHGPGNGKAPGQGDLGPYALPGTADRNVLNEKNDPHDDDWS